MNAKINILFMLPNFDTGGSEKLVADLARSLNRDKFAPVVCVFFGGIYVEEMRKKGIPCYVVHEDGKVKGKMAIVRFLNDVIRRHHIEIVNTHHSSPLFQGLLSFKLFNRVKVIHTEHTKLNFDPNYTERIIRMERFFLKFVDLALGISQGVCDYFADKLNVPQKKIVKVLNGVDIERFQFSQEQKQELNVKYRQEFKIDSEEVVIGMCANFREQKNHPNLVKAASLLKERKAAGFRVVLAGNGPELASIKKMVQEKGLEDIILFPGARLDVPEMMNMFDVYCLPSFFEGLPFSLIEAMAIGIPAVATNVDGNKEVVLDGHNGFLVPDDNPLELADALETLLKDADKRQHMGMNAKKRALDFSFNKMIHEYEELFACQN